MTTITKQAPVKLRQGRRGLSIAFREISKFFRTNLRMSDFFSQFLAGSKVEHGGGDGGLFT